MPAQRPLKAVLVNSRFECDSEKARAYEAKHGASFLEASEVFGDDLSVSVESTRRPIAKARMSCSARASARRSS